MSRCKICGGIGCPSCTPPQRPHATAGDLFDSFLTESLGVSPVAIHGDSGESPKFAVWCSSRLDYFRSVVGSFPLDIGFHGCRFPPDGSYRMLDPFWLAWLCSRVEALAGAQKAQGRDRLRSVITEAINAGALPESFDDSAHWPKIYPAGYQPPFSEISTKYWPMRLDDFGHVR